MDGVLADIYSQYQRYEYEETGYLRNIQETNGLTEREAFPSCEKYTCSEGFFRTAPVIEGSVEGLEYLNDKYEVIILSSATEYPQSLSEKVYWLNEHYPFIVWQQMVFCGRKDLVMGDIMIDDHPKNLDYFTGEKFVFTQPHNSALLMPGCKRVASWKEIRELL